MKHASAFDRRHFLAATTSIASLVVTSRPVAAAEAPGFRGIYPIAWTPCTPDGALDISAMAAQVAFCRRGGVAGLVWPQNASAWATLSEQEWTNGMRALLSAAKGGKTRIVIGVQTVGGDTAKSVRYTKLAAAQGADGIISLPPENATEAQIVAYYRAIGAATPLPLMMQVVGNASVDLVIELSKKVPTLKAVKDEAGDPLGRAPQILKGTEGKLADFSGNGGHTMLAEMGLGFSGSCPYVGLADLYQSSFDLWHAGDRKAAFDMFGRISAFNSIPGSNEYVLVARGVFSEDTVLRKAAGAHASPILEPQQKQFIRDAMERFLKPYAKA
ncbi:MAG: dihydrodipicolinate synthase family protein [Alphaproteobacteria bacterium]|nr:dihydrodipicolinate synthase family protein [Alphaproteobacteria bacterium]